MPFSAPPSIVSFSRFPVQWQRMGKGDMILMILVCCSDQEAPDVPQTVAFDSNSSMDISFNPCSTLFPPSPTVQVNAPRQQKP